jgi:hypothetical protein
MCEFNMSKAEKSKTSVAWQVSEDFDGHACIVFHHHGLAARREGANELNSDFDSVELKRAPEFDSYADEGFVPNKILIESGWWFECHHCGHKLHEDDEENERNDYVYVNQSVYCNPTCQHKLDKTINDQKTKFESFKRLIQEKRPDLVFSDFHGKYPCITMSAHFTFKGCVHKGSVKGEELDKLDWTVAQSDIPAWNDYELLRKSETSNVSH